MNSAMELISSKMLNGLIRSGRRLLLRSELIECSFCTAATKTTSPPPESSFLHDAFTDKQCGLYDKRAFQYRDLKIIKATPEQMKEKPGPETQLVFGHQFADHMLEIKWSEDKGWGQPLISPLHNLSMHPASKVLCSHTALAASAEAY
ncbi:unnamed protein product [Gongylonema pulchrum]|uniref:Branched-chain-amino-acid transaminase n=1 Tax=Gongylonema pulchrum TaxID=637853 RepID=A0A183ET59_9BILA|nr:unnamed protein product [Gongylonema pulchrum]